MVINLEQKRVHFDLRFILTYNIHMSSYDLVHIYVTQT